VLTTEASALRGMVFAGRELPESGVQGDQGLLGRFLGLFPRPEVFAA
jgi:hypothetical protein